MQIRVNFDEQLAELVAETCRANFGSYNRQQGLSAIIRLIIKSDKLWKENSPYYEDALQQTWIYFCRNLCESTTAEKYDPSRSSVITWVNAYLKRRIQDYRIQSRATAEKMLAATGRLIDFTEALKAPPDIPLILEDTMLWVETDPDGELRRIHIEGYPQVTCQALLLKRLPPETHWETLATQFGLSVSTLSSFYRRQCLPRLRQFGELQGYL